MSRAVCVGGLASVLCWSVLGCWGVLGYSNGLVKPKSLTLVLVCARVFAWSCVYLCLRVCSGIGGSKSVFVYQRECVCYVHGLTCVCYVQ